MRRRRRDTAVGAVLDGAHGMAIITISRGSGTGGRVLAEEVADRLGYDVVSREEIVRQATEYGASEQDLRTALMKPPRLWERFHHQRRRYLAFVQAALCARVRGGRVVYHGNAGHLLLPGISHVLCVRLIAPLEFRVRMLREHTPMTEAEAEAYVHKVDHERERWTRFLYGVDWLDPHLYDVCLNLRTLSIADAVDMLESASRSERFTATADSRRAMEDLVLASRVKASLAADPRTASADVAIRAETGCVFLRGRLRPASLVDAVIEVAGAVDGVECVDREDLGAPEYTV